MNDENKNIKESDGIETPDTANKEKAPGKGSGRHGRAEKDELDDRLNSFGKILKKSLSGDVLAKDVIKSQAGVIVLVAFIIILSTSNRYSCQQSHIRESELKKELSDAKNKAFSSFSLLTEKSRRSKLLEGLKSRKDSSLQIAEQPPYIVEVPQIEKDEQ